MRVAAGVLLEPGIIAELRWILAEKIVRLRPGPAGILPFRFRGQAIPIRLVMAGPGLWIVTRLQSLERRSPVAKAHRIGPTHLFHRIFRPFPARGVLVHYLLK